MDPFTNPAFIIFTGVSPLLIALVKQSGLPSQANAIIALACYIVIGILGVLLSGEPLTIENAVQLITTATVVGSAAYGLIWSNLGGDISIDERLTAATSFVK
jgi:hypothetical protein